MKRFKIRKNIYSFVLALIMMLGVIGENVYAQVSNYPQTLDEAKEYLLQNRKIYIIKNGQTCEYEYEFQTEKDLDKAAEYKIE